MIKLNKVNKKDKVAILSPSSGIAGIFPWVADYGLSRLKSIFGLVPVEYPTTRLMGSTLKNRAKDINDAFSDDEIKAVFTMIGGDDQIQLLKYLDIDIIKKNPKPFFGYSDNTHLCNLLFNLNIPSYYGGSIMGEFGFNKTMPKETLDSLGWALHDRGEKIITPSVQFNTIGLSWSDKELLEQEKEFEDNEGFLWDGTKSATGILWGGCLESLIALTTAGNDKVFYDTDESIILFLETSEALPPAWIVKYYLIGLGERGLFGGRIKGIIIGRPKTWEFDNQKNKDERKAYLQEQIKAITDVIRHYDKSIPLVLNVDFGHTAPQYIIPMGNICSINPTDKILTFNY